MNQETMEEVLTRYAKRYGEAEAEIERRRCLQHPTRLGILRDALRSSECMDAYHASRKH